MHVFELPVELLQRIGQLCSIDGDWRDTLNLALSCTRMNKIFEPSVWHAVTCISTSHVEKLHCALSERPLLAQHVRHLKFPLHWLTRINYSFDVKKPSSDIVIACEQVSRVLESIGARLLSLQLVCFSYTVTIRPSVAPAIAKLTGLTSLRLEDVVFELGNLEPCSTLSSDFLAPMKAFSLRRFDFTTSHPFDLIHHCQNTLESVELVGGIIPENMDGRSWPNVVVLSIQSVSFHLATLQRAFPNVRALAYGRCDIQDADIILAPGWPKLELVRLNDDPEPQEFALQCRVDRLDILRNPVTDDDSLAYFERAIKDFQPRVLRMSANMHLVDQCLSLCSECLPLLRILHLDIRVPIMNWAIAQNFAKRLCLACSAFYALESLRIDVAIDPDEINFKYLSYAGLDLDALFTSSGSALPNMEWLCVRYGYICFGTAVKRKFRSCRARTLNKGANGTTNAQESVDREAVYTGSTEQMFDGFEDYALYEDPTY